ncbi:MAG TPA: ComEC/Rec2 family competence protein [Candidatus Cybelea sp.]|nr:ComEC/Rec2 family competence protein [Candidatus Cybelea sp.]
MRALGLEAQLGRAVRRFPWAAWAAREFAAERGRWPLWLPAGLGLGIAIYFALPFEPARWIGLAWLALGAALALVFRRDLPLVLLGLAVATPAAGFALAQARTAAVAAPVLVRATGATLITGRVVYISAADKRQRVLLDRLAIERVPPAATPERIRVTASASHEPLHPGDWVRLRASLLPPPAPAMPGTLDYPRQAFFQRLGGVGFALGAPKPIEPPQHGAASTFAGEVQATLNRARQTVMARVQAVLPGPTGALAAALMTGDRSAIPDDVTKAMQDSGLAHLLVIAGLHLSFVAGIIFFAVRFLLAAIPPIALNWPTKKIAAGATLLGTFGYLIISGATVPTQRAFLMTSVAVLAVMLDRQAISMRVVAWAALLILALQPESLLDVSFQMSFAAVVALIATYEVASGPLGAWRARHGRFGHLASHLIGVGLTTLVAGFATAPFALYHFNRFVDYGLLGNMLAVPLTGIWVMPWALVAYLLMPLGLERIGLVPMGLGVDLVIWIARRVAGLPGAVLLLPPLPLWGMALTGVGGLWLCLWRRPWRRAGVLAMAAGLGAILITPRPDILIDGEGKYLAVRAADNRLMVSPARGARIAEQTWLRHDGQLDAAPWPALGESYDGRLRCDALGCDYRAHDLLIALPRDEAALAEDCRRADVVVASVPVRGRCSSARIVVDRFDLWRRGGHAIYLRDDGTVRIETVADWRGVRPWSQPPTPRSAAPMVPRVQPYAGG